MFAQSKPECADFCTIVGQSGLSTWPGLTQSLAMDDVANPTRAGEIIRRARESKGWSQEKLVSKTRTRKIAGGRGVSKTTLQNIEQGKHKGRGPNGATIIALVRALEADSLDELAVRVGVAAQNNGQRQTYMPWFKSLARVGASWDTEMRDIQTQEADEWIPNWTSFKDAFVVRIDGDSMEPDYPNGWNVVASRSAPVESGKAHLCFGVDDGAALLRIVDLSDDGHSITLSPLNRRDGKYKPRTFDWSGESPIKLVRVVGLYKALL